ncbi:hypothetical protein BJV77DRAFT_1061785 [Russula vinacea]|nr:hypothetical protein BJV77DRAFT_1061785 [Russula vinacea]
MSALVDGTWNRITRHTLYCDWADKNNFPSMLPRDTKNHRESAAADTQSRLDPHLKEKLVKERVILYTDDLFQAAAIEWLVSTDQPIQALQHPAFQIMIHSAARATNGVNIPNGRQTQQAIMDAFKKQLTALRTRLTICTTI